MNKDVIIKKLEETIASMRQALAKNEGSTIQIITSGLKSFFDKAKTKVSGNETTQKLVSETKRYINELEKALRSGDKKLSANVLDKAQKLLEDYKDKKDASS